MLRERPWDRTQVSERELARVLEEEAAAARRPLGFVAAFDAENYWRGRGEAAIREEMDRRLERRRIRGRRDLVAVA